jgi:hypothetical protein
VCTWSQNPIAPVRTCTVKTRYQPLHVAAYSIMQKHNDMESIRVCTLGTRVQCVGSLARVRVCAAAHTSSPLRLGAEWQC